MRRDMVAGLHFFCIIGMAIASVPVNLGAFLSNGADIVHFCFSLTYLSLWLSLLYWITKAGSSAIHLYLGFWAAELIYFTLFSFAIEVDLLSMVWFVGVLFLLLPLMGFYLPYSVIEDTLRIDFLYDAVMLPFFTLSLIMLLIGLVAKRRMRR